MHSDDPRVDRGRSAVYQAEESIARIMRGSRRSVRLGRAVVVLPAEVRFGTLDAIQRFVDAVLSDPPTCAQYPGRGPAQVESRRGFRCATYESGRIRVPDSDPRGRWALTRSVVLHECAHHLAGAPGHGPQFRGALSHLYRAHLGEGAATLLEHLLAPLDDLPDVDPGRDDQPPSQRRVAALLAKAQSTTSAEEAEAYLAKAALVAQRHSVTLAVGAWSASGTPGTPTHRMLPIGQPRARSNPHLVALLLAIARSWSVPVDIGQGSTYCLLYGMPADLDQVEAIYVSASALMARRAEEHVRSGSWRGTLYRPEPGEPDRPVTATVARNAFCMGFVERVRRRLALGARDARSQSDIRDPAGGLDAGSMAGTATSRAGVDLALRARDLAVTDYHRQITRARGLWRGSSSAAGAALASRHAGARAADELDRRGLPSTSRAALDASPASQG